MHVTLRHHGFVVAGLPQTYQGQLRTAEITGGSFCSAAAIAAKRCA